jgi:hypothetical protein
MPTTDVRQRNIYIAHQTICDLGIQEGIVPLTGEGCPQKIAVDIEGWRVVGEITLTSRNKGVSGQDIDLIVVDLPDFGETTPNGRTLPEAQIDIDFQG